MNNGKKQMEKKVLFLCGKDDIFFLLTSSAPPRPVENAAEKPSSRASSEALGQRWPPSSETVEVGRSDVEILGGWLANF